MDNASIAAMPPEETLAAMQTAVAATTPDANTAATLLPPSGAADAQRRLDVLSNDKDWAAKLLAGDVATRKEFFELSTAAAPADEYAEALSEPTGFVETTVNGALPRRHVIEYVENMRQVGLSDGVIAEALTAAPVTKAVYEATRQFQRAKHGDAGWVERLLKGSYAERREHELMCIILSSPIVG